MFGNAESLLFQIAFKKERLPLNKCHYTVQYPNEGRNAMQFILTRKGPYLESTFLHVSYYMSDASAPCLSDTKSLESLWSNLWTQSLLGRD